MGHMDLDPQVHNKRVLENLGWAVGSTRALGRVASDELYDLASGGGTTPCVHAGPT